MLRFASAIAFLLALCPSARALGAGGVAPGVIRQNVAVARGKGPVMARSGPGEVGR